jgi:hypothetical protein
MSVTISPPMYLQFFDPNNSGAPLVGGKLFTYVAGTSTKQATWTDSTQSVQNNNPIILDSNGVANVWLDPTLLYKFVLSPANDTDPPNSPLRSVDNISPLLSAAALTPAIVGPGLYPKTATEVSAGVTIVNFNYPPLTVDRYGTNTTPGTTVMTTAWQAAINVAKKNGGVVTWGPGPYLIDAALDLTNPVGSQNCTFALIGQGRFKAPTNSTGQTATPSIIVKHASPGNAFDTTGSQGIHFENMSIASDNTNYPNTCFLLARNSDGNSRTDRIINCYVFGPFHQTILYNYGAEDDMHWGCQFYNTASDANTSVLDITGFNIRTVASAFTTIATGSQSCLDHKIFGGEYANLFTSGGATADVFRFEAARQIKIYAPWMNSAIKSGSGAGRALIYLDGTNAATQGLYLHGIDGEAAPAPANYGILFSAHARTHVDILIEACWFPNTTNIMGGGTAGMIVSALKWINTVTGGPGGGISITGQFQNCEFDGTSGTVVASAGFDNFCNTVYGSALIQNNGESDLNFRDFSQASGSQWKKIRNSSGALVISACGDTGTVATSNVQYNTSGTTQQLGKFYPVQDTGAPQTTAGMYAGSGVPSNSNGSNGDFYFRGDTPGTVNQRIYVKSAGAWVGIV